MITVLTVHSLYQTADRKTFSDAEEMNHLSHKIYKEKPPHWHGVMFSFLLTIGSFLAFNTPLIAQQTVLDGYIKEAFQQSPLLYQDSLALKKSEVSKEIAKSYYLPTTALQMGYQTSLGGRNIDLPVGDLLNGVYSTLNQLTGTSSFPQIKNEKVDFFPQNFYDVKVRTTVPLYNPEIRPNIELAGHQIKGSQLDLQIRKRDLAKQVKEAYFNFLLASDAKQIYQEVLDLANEGKRVNERLLKNGKGLPAYILRSEAEIEAIQAELFKADVQLKNAQSWFNFLLNRKEEGSIDTSFDESVALVFCTDLLAAGVQVNNREEIQGLENASGMLNKVIQLNKSAGKPHLNGIFDLGSQASDWQFDNQSRYFLLALQLDIPIFSGSRTRKKVEQSLLDLKQNQSRREYVEKQLSLSAQTAVNNLKAALETVKARKKQVEAAGTYKRLIDKGYAEGVSTFIETIDARNQWMQAQIAYRIQVYETLKSAAEVERELALYPI